MMRLPMVVVGILTLMLTACGSDPGGFETRESDRGEADYQFVIPYGAGEAFDAGEPLEILPQRLEVSVGETIEIVNDDVRGHLVGPFFIGAGETLRQTYTSKGEYTGLCSVHPSGEIVIVVT
ncbi:MAG: hypothetical protein R2695_00630 [Acidimicrobiales bacterium]